MSTTVHTGRFTAEVPDDGLVVFLIGLRINRLRRVWSWWPVARRMPVMMARLESEPARGLLHSRWFWSGRTVLLVQYWRSTTDLEAFAQDRSEPHVAAWHRFMRELAGSGDVGIFHETFVVPPDAAEALYSDMPRIGLAAAAGHVPVGSSSQRFRQRLGRSHDRPRS